MSLVLHLKRYALQAIHEGKFKLSFKSSLVNFNLRNLTLLFDLESFNHLSLGDKVELNKYFSYLLPEQEEKIKSFGFGGVDDMVVAGFLEITGTSLNNPLKTYLTRHTFCILVNIGCNITMSLTTDKNSNVLLFWPEQLKVIQKGYI